MNKITYNSLRFIFKFQTIFFQTVRINWINLELIGREEKMRSKTNLSNLCDPTLRINKATLHYFI